MPPLVVYLVIGAGAAVENFIPPIPADTFVLLGAFLAAFGRAGPWLVFFWTWIPNVGAALAVYRLSAKHGRAFLRTRAGHWLLHPEQLETIRKFYARWGTPAIFVSRFLPGIRAMVPVFAGVSHVSFWKMLLPTASASGIWYGTLVYVGNAAGRHWREILAAFSRVSDILLWIALPLLALLLLWWWRSRRKHRRAG